MRRAASWAVTIQSQSIHFDRIEVGQFVQKGQDSPFVIQDGLLQ